MKDRLRIVLLIVLPLAVIPIAAGWTQEILKALMKGQESDDLWLLWLSLALLAVAIFFLLRFGRRYLPARVLKYDRNFSSRNAVVAMLSKCDNLKVSGEGFVIWEWVGIGKDRQPGKEVSLPLDIEHDTSTSADPPLPQWTWQQTLRAAKRNRDSLQHIVLVGSTNGSGTKDQLSLCERFLRAYFPDVKIEPLPATADFENIEQLMGLLKQAVGHLNDVGYPDRDIIVDCTGGQKTASIAAALVTLDHPDLMFQYVGTGASADKVLGFNVASELHAG